MSPRAARFRARARAVETSERNARRYRRTGRPGMIRDGLAFAAIGAALYASIPYLPALAAALN